MNSILSLFDFKSIPSEFINLLSNQSECIWHPTGYRNSEEIYAVKKSLKDYFASSDAIIVLKNDPYLNEKDSLGTGPAIESVISEYEKAGFEYKGTLKLNLKNNTKFLLEEVNENAFNNNNYEPNAKAYISKFTIEINNIPKDKNREIYTVANQMLGLKELKNSGKSVYAISIGMGNLKMLDEILQNGIRIEEIYLYHLEPGSVRAITTFIPFYSHHLGLKRIISEDIYVDLFLNNELNERPYLDFIDYFKEKYGDMLPIENLVEVDRYSFNSYNDIKQIRMLDLG